MPYRLPIILAVAIILIGLFINTRFLPERRHDLAKRIILAIAYVCMCIDTTILARTRGPSPLAATITALLFAILTITVVWPKPLGIIVDWMISIQWRRLPIIGHILYWMYKRREKRHRKALEERAAVLPFEELRHTSIFALQAERLAEYLVWLEERTESHAPKRTTQEMLELIQKLVAEHGESMLREFQRSAYEMQKQLLREQATANTLSETSKDVL